MALLPDPDPGYPNRHSRLIWWQNEALGNVLRWPRPSGDNCASFPTLPPIGTWSPGANIFCSGHVPLADGRLFTAGGNESEHLWGITDSRIYDPLDGTWTEQPGMAEARWYPTATVLRDSRVLVAAGNKGEQLWLFGGRRNGVPPASPAGDSVHRFGRSTEQIPEIPDGYWDPSVEPLADGVDRPAPREGHTVALLVDPVQSDPTKRAQFFFGGRNADGDPVLPEVWVLRRETGEALDPDYTYQWVKLTVQGDPPAGRSEHTAVARSSTELFIFGGLKKAGGVETPTAELWRLYRDPQNPTQWLWEPIPPAGTPPSARWGHAAVFQPASQYHGDRMLVFGGAESPGAGGPLAENRLWVFDFATRTWSEKFTRDDFYYHRPAPRRDHAMTSDPLNPSIVVLYGGHLGATVEPISLWGLNTEVAPPDSAYWVELVSQGTSPGPRAGHSATYDYGYGLSEPLAPAQRRLYIFGGVVGDPPQPADQVVYMVEPSGDRQWYPSRVVPFSLSGHTAELDPYGLMFSRTPESFDPASTTWTRNPATSWNQEYYQLHFVVPGNPSGGGRVLAAGKDPQARYLDIPASGPAGGWQVQGSGGSGVSGFAPSTGVMYEPGRILIAGGIHNQAVTGLSKTLDARSTTNGWMDTSTPNMAPRLQHNLVLLPTGEVLAVGGVTELAEVSTAAQECPQLWSPATRSWTPIGDLACDRVGGTPIIRNYHSTALLLPDARVISAGGFGGGNPYKNYARIFCPPYLFKPGAPTEFAPRPVITAAPSLLTWGQVFTLCTPNPDAVQKVCLIRAGSTTHSFDENQRYVELTKLGTASNPPRLFVTAPASRDDAPPGDYLLFLVGSADGTGSYPDAPSIAEWVRMQAPAGTDLCDVVAPATITLEPDIVGPTSIFLIWTATADDGILAPSGIAQRFDLRKSIFPITSEYTWAYAGPVPGVPTPGTVGTYHDLTVEGLLPCTVYHFSIRAEDDKPNLGALPPDLEVMTTCGGGGGEEFSAHAATAGENAAGAETATATGSPATLVAETRRLADGRWRVRLRLTTEADGLASNASEIVVEREGMGGERDTLGRFRPGEGDDLLGLCALRDKGRVAIPGVSRVERVMSRLRRGGQRLALVEASHSRLGALGGEFVANGGSVELLGEDLVDLTYAPASESLDQASAWYLLVRRQGAASPQPFSQRRSLVGPLPERFALHPSDPNPATAGTLLRFDLPVESAVRLEVFDLLGRRVATVVEGTYPAGSHTRAWDLTGVDGARVRPGIYICRMSAGTFRARGKLSVLP